MVLGAKNGINALVLDGVFLFVRVLGTGMAPIHNIKKLTFISHENIHEQFSLPFLSHN